MDNHTLPQYIVDKGGMNYIRRLCDMAQKNDYSFSVFLFKKKDYKGLPVEMTAKEALIIFNRRDSCSISLDPDGKLPLAKDGVCYNKSEMSTILAITLGRGREFMTYCIRRAEND